MTANPRAEAIITSHIERCKKEKVLCSFINLEGVTHAAIRGRFIDSYRFEDRNVVGYGPSLKSGDIEPIDHILNAHVFRKDTSWGILEKPPAKLEEVASNLLSQIVLPERESKPFETDEIIAYSIYVTTTCWCKTQRLVTQGCPSTGGLRCPSKGSLVDGWIATV